MRRAALIGAALAAAFPGGAEAQTAHGDLAVGEQVLAGVLGVEFGGRVSPGGVHVGGSYLYQLTDQDWFEGGLSFTIGGGQAACFRDRDDDFLCDHGILDGFGGEIAGGVRRFFFARGKGGFLPYARAAVGLRLVSYAADDVTGLAVPLELGGGVRVRVADRVFIAGGAELRLGPAWFNHGLGSEPHIGLAIHGGVEFTL